MERCLSHLLVCESTLQEQVALSSFAAERKSRLHHWVAALFVTLFCAASAFAAPPAAPIGLRCVVTGSTSLTLIWEDNATDETGFEIAYTENGTPYTLPINGSFPGTGTASIVLTVAANGVYTFQVRTTKTGETASAYSNTINVNLGAFSAPTNLSAAVLSETSVQLIWVDNAYTESGYFIEYRESPNGTWTLAGSVAANSCSCPFTGLPPGTSYEVRVGAYIQNADNTYSYSAYSNVASITTPFYPPTNFVATPSSTSPNQISFTWADNSSAESGYELQYRKQNLANPAAFVSRKVTAANATSISNLPEFEPGTIYEFRLRACSASSYSVFSSTATATTINGFSSKPYAPITLGAAFSYQIAAQGQTARTNWSVGTLPPGLSFDSASGIISGTPTVAGVYTIPLTANFVGGTTGTQSLVLRVITPPAPPKIVATIPAQTLTQSGSATIALNTKFADPDTESAVRMVTSKGDLDLILNSTSTPMTVANFLSYANDYANTIFHRSIAGFVLQGGGYKFNTSLNAFEHIAAGTPVVNEPGISNLFGTLAMAKIADNPDSATNEFFVNVGDNSANLDSQNGGFTVFGRVATPSIAGALTNLASVPTGTYNLSLHTGPLATDIVSTAFSDFPVDTGGQPLGITSVTALPVLTYAVTVPPNSAVATATLSGSSIQINAVASGTTSVTVGATDVDGNTTTQTFAITVQQTFAEWASAQGYNGGQAGLTADANSNGLTNLQEFAFLATPSSGGSAQLPTLAMKTVAQSEYGEITFPVRKYAVGLTYAVEASSTLAGNDWTTLWTSADGFTAPVVSGVVDQTDRTVVTVRDTQPASSSSRRFLRVKITGQ